MNSVYDSPHRGYPLSQPRLKTDFLGSDEEENLPRGPTFCEARDGAAQGLRPSRHAARRRYSEVPSSDEDDAFDEDADLSMLTPNAQRRAKR